MWASEPTLDEWGEYDNTVAGFGSLDLNAARRFGLCLKPGECKRVRFHAEVVDE